MLSQAGFPREEADVEICRQKSVCVWGGVAWEWTAVGSKGRKQTEERWAVTGPGQPRALRGALELEGSSGLSQFAERGPGP